MLEKLTKDPAVRSLLVLIFGLLLLDFFFTIFFNSSGVTKYLDLAESIIRLLMLLLVTSLFYGLYMMLKENAQPWLESLKASLVVAKCGNCGRTLENSWNCCPACGWDVPNEKHQN